MTTQNEGKLIFAVLQGEDYDEVVEQLNKNGFYVTMLNSSGGFLKKRSVTIMIGVENERFEAAVEILKREAGKRKETIYRSIPLPHGEPTISAPTFPVEVERGGATIFVLNMDSMEKF